MLAPPQRHKRPRPRSPSPLGSEPDIDLASPLDILLKRQRREDRFWTSTSTGGGTGGYEDTHEQGGESSLDARRRSMAGVERRRTRQWERQNAPQSQSQSQPETEPDHYLSPGASAQHPHSHRQRYLSPSASAAQPTNPMSSSPIRNHPPSSSPFRDKSSSQTQQSQSHWFGMPDEDYHAGYGYNHHVEPEPEIPAEMDVEEMRREWGEEYAVQNSLLHSLHLARLGSQNQNQNQDHWNITHDITPDSTQTTLISTPTLASASPQQYTYSYRQPTSTYPDSSPLQSQSYEPRVHAYAHQDVDDQDEEMGMEVLDDWQGGREREVDFEVTKRYEDANRLLAELDMARRRRWGE